MDDSVCGRPWTVCRNQVWIRSRCQCTRLRCRGCCDCPRGMGWCALQRRATLVTSNEHLHKHQRRTNVPGLLVAWTVKFLICIRTGAWYVGYTARHVLQVQDGQRHTSCELRYLVNSTTHACTGLESRLLGQWWCCHAMMG